MTVWEPKTPAWDSLPALSHHLPHPVKPSAPRGTHTLFPMTVNGCGSKGGTGTPPRGADVVERVELKSIKVEVSRLSRHQIEVGEKVGKREKMVREQRQLHAETRRVIQQRHERSALA